MAAMQLGVVMLGVVEPEAPQSIRMVQVEQEGMEDTPRVSHRGVVAPEAPVVRVAFRVMMGQRAIQAHRLRASASSSESDRPGLHSRLTGFAILPSRHDFADSSSRSPVD